MSAYPTPGVATSAPPGFVVSNLDPYLNSAQNNEIYDPNFIPGFQSGLTNTSISWQTGPGYARIGYQVGPWSQVEFSVPHFAMGPQCCNFVEVPHTQQFRLPSWGDYYYVMAGLGPPGVNVVNYTASFGAPSTYVGLRTDWNWTLRISLDWHHPVLLGQRSEMAAIGVAVTQYVPSEPKKLVYTLVNFWMDRNSSRTLNNAGTREISPPNLVTYHPLQLQSEGNQTITLNLSPYLADTIRTLNLTTSDTMPPLISYVYLNVEGYNFKWNSTVWSFIVMTQGAGGQTSTQQPYLVGGAVLIVAVGAVLLYYRKSGRTHG